MESALLVCSQDKSRQALADLLKAGDCARITTCASGSEARRTMAENEFALILINAPLADESGQELALRATETMAGVILLVKEEFAEEMAGKVEREGVLVLPKPLGRALFFQSLKILAAARRRVLGLQRENVLLQKKVEEVRLVNRAKCVLIQVLSMTEPQAHRYIEKQAMDMRLPKRVIAEGILKTYEP